jgi:hypothetical protein
METHQHVESTGIELAGGTELTVPIEKAMAGHSNGEGGPRAGEGREVERGARERWSMARRGTRYDTGWGVHGE